MNRQRAINYLKFRMQELSNYMINIRDPHEVDKVLKKYLKFHDLLKELENERG